MDSVDIVIGELVFRDVAVPTRFAERWRGMRSVAGAMLFDGPSVHSFGMDRPLTVVGIGSDQRVVAVRMLAPARVLVLAARRILELETFIIPPRLGDRVRFYDRRHGGTSGGVRDSDREPGRHFRAPGSDTPFR